jgi:hypothetical protein
MALLRLSLHSTINSTSDFGRSYLKGIRANIELLVYSVTCCWPYLPKAQSYKIKKWKVATKNQIGLRKQLTTQ